jgi:hypothetical protein
VLVLPAAALAQSQANGPLTGNMAAPAARTHTASSSRPATPTAASQPVVTAVPVHQPPPVATAQAGNSGPVWEIEVPLSNQPSTQPPAQSQNSATASRAAEPVVTFSNDPAQTAPTHSQNGHAPTEDRVGDTTAKLLAAQANGTYAGKEAGTLGAEATLSYKRYLDSFKLPIPQWFKGTVSSDTGGSTQ